MISHFFTAPFFLHPLLPDEGPDGAESYDFVQGVSLVDQQGGCALHLVFLRQFRMLFGEDFRKGGAVFSSSLTAILQLGQVWVPNRIHPLSPPVLATCLASVGAVFTEGFRNTGRSAGASSFFRWDWPRS